ncbi:MAG: DUF2330 domain-containing protein [Polyangiaceae bacterium]|nr:DUF2330 domain-containing protein [Polyangiaceae bacterium]
MRVRLALVLAASLLASEARAAGAFVVDPPSSAFVEEVRAAVSVDPSGSTIWLGARLAGAADHVVWIVPREAGVAVDLASSAWLDALEDATAPRVLAPQGSLCDGPPELVSTGDSPVGVEPPVARRIESAAALADAEAAWSLALDPTDRVALLASLAEGDELLAVRWTPRDGESSTPVLRLRGGPGAVVPMQLTRAEAGQPIAITVSLVASARATAPLTSLVAIADADLSWPGGAASYAGARDALLSTGTAARFIVESASPTALTAGEWVTGAGKAPSAADAFLRRAALRGELPGDVGQVTAAIAPALAGDAVFAAPCARGDLVAGGPCAGGPALGAGSLGRADDLAFALAGTPRQRWVTRLAGRIPAGGRGKALSLAVGDGGAMPVLRRAGDDRCASATGPFGGGPSGATPAGPSAGGPAPGAPSQPSQPVEDEPPPPSSSQSTVDVNVGCHTDGAQSCSSDSSSDAGDDGCSSDSSGDADDDGCSSDSSGDADDGGCSGESAGDEGSGCGSSDGGEGSGSGCSGGDGSSTGGCTSNGGGSSGGDCTVSRARRRRPSKWAFFVLALAFPLRRWSRRA